MKWDDDKFEGQRNEWQWFLSRTETANLRKLVLREHQGLRLWLATLDGIQTLPGYGEIALGWRSIDEKMISPPITPKLYVPQDQYDEWYIFEGEHFQCGEFARFIGHGGIHLADPRAITESYDPTWDKSACDWLYPVQEQFWSQIDAVRPITYIGIGDYDLVVTRRESFAQALRDEWF